MTYKSLDFNISNPLVDDPIYEIPSLPPFSYILPNSVEQIDKILDDDEILY